MYIRKATSKTVDRKGWSPGSPFIWIRRRRTAARTNVSWRRASGPALFASIHPECFHWPGPRVSQTVDRRKINLSHNFETDGGAYGRKDRPPGERVDRATLTLSLPSCIRHSGAVNDGFYRPALNQNATGTQTMSAPDRTYFRPVVRRWLYSSSYARVGP